MNILEAIDAARDHAGPSGTAFYHNGRCVVGVRLPFGEREAWGVGPTWAAAVADMKFGEWNGSSHHADAVNVELNAESMEALS